ncbi:hypothetical protein FG379_000008 [Cryptosporidium bovis]|uniref:uncharacterized protein n=1 Tax=Cryptosporidium bovis TaxID=310047 RepID=UPI003519F95C|nr:hypothetical protein FG379_000008 [Cryptosporidium bovis]
MMLKIYFGDSEEYSSYLILDNLNEQIFKIENKNTSNIELNSTISTINGDNENIFKQGDFHSSSKKKIKELLDDDTVSLLRGENDNFVHKNKKTSEYGTEKQLDSKKFNRNKKEDNNINTKNIKKSNCNNYFADNYLKYIWEVGDEFSDLHCFYLNQIKGFIQ